LLKIDFEKIFYCYKPFLLFDKVFFFYRSYFKVLGSFEDNKIDSYYLSRQEYGTIAGFVSSGCSYRRKQRETFIKLIYNHKYVARIIEGCNAISIIILFISFVVSFSGKLKPTLLLFWRKRTGLRIKCDANRHAECLDVSFSWPSVFLARCVIPSVYLWVVFILWVIWVSKFSLYAKTVSHKVRVTIGFVLVVFPSCRLLRMNCFMILF
jgi:exosortase family protein XrtF